MPLIRARLSVRRASGSVQISITLKIPNRHQLVSDKWSRANTVRKVEFKLFNSLDTSATCLEGMP